MAISPIQVVGPRPEPPQEKKPSAFDTVLQALQLANAAFNIPVNVQKIRQSEADIELAEAQLKGLPEQQRLQKEKFEADITSKQSSAALADQRRQEILDKPEREEKIRSAKISREDREKLGQDVIEFQKSDAAKKNINRILEGRIMQRALANGSGPATFVSQIGLIRGIAGDVGPALARELNASLDRQGLSEKFTGLVERWFANKAMTPEERKVLSGVIRDITSESRKTLNDLERGRAEVLAKKYSTVDFDTAMDFIDSRQFINEAAEKSIKAINEGRTEPVSAEKIADEMGDIVVTGSKVIEAGNQVLDAGLGEAAEGLKITAKSLPRQAFDAYKEVVTGAALQLQEILEDYGIVSPTFPPRFPSKDLQKELQNGEENIPFRPPSPPPVGLPQQPQGQAQPPPKGLGDLVRPKRTTNNLGNTIQKRVITKPGVK